MTSPGPIAFSILGFDIMWYGILIAAAFLLAIYISYRRSSIFCIEPDEIFNLSIYMLPFSIIGARLYYVVFSWSLYKSNLLSIFNLREGGLAIHGGLIAGGICIFLFCKSKKISILNFSDLLLPSVALAQSIGRWGNFFNSEAHGRPTDLPWGIYVDGIKVHPTFLYESIWCLFLFIFLSLIIKKRRFKGEISTMYGCLYSLERFFVEGLRTDSLMIGPFRQAQVISIIIATVSICGYIYLYRKSKTTKAGNIML